MIGLIWAQARGGVIGADGTLPWHLPEDLAHFRETTAGAAVLMGRRTWDSLPERFRPLPGRRNLVLTRRAGWAAPGARPVSSPDDAVAAAGDGPLWVIGGGEVYAATVGRADRAEVTEIDLEVDGDTVAPVLGPAWSRVEGEWRVSRTGLRYRFVTCVVTRDEVVSDPSDLPRFPGRATKM